MKNIADWSHTERWLQYAVRLRLRNEPRESLQTLHDQALEDGKIRAWLSNVSAFHDTVASGHKNPMLPIHQLHFLLALGFGTEVPEIRAAMDAIALRTDACGVWQSSVLIPEHYGGNGKLTGGWALCDAPLMAAALLKAGTPYESIRPGVDHLLSLAGQTGFPCAVSPELGSFRGPGKKDDLCPYATLAMLQLLAELPELREGKLAKSCVDALLCLWDNSRERHPYMFYMGTDFRKLKAPPMWYDLVSVLACLSQFECARSDTRFSDMLALLTAKQGQDGWFIPESIYLKCKEWDFGQKKEPSPYLTFCCLNIARRVGTLEPLNA